MTNALRTMPFVASVLKDFMRTSGLEPTLLGEKNMRVLTARPGQVEFELDIQKQHTNRLGIIHGGTIASMVDLGGSLAVASMGLYSTGVSTDLNVTYLASGGSVGQKLKVLAECQRMGATLAYTQMSFFNQKGGLCARGSHTKFITKARMAQASPYHIPGESNEGKDGSGFS